MSAKGTPVSDVCICQHSIHEHGPEMFVTTHVGCTRCPCKKFESDTLKFNVLPLPIDPPAK